MNTTKISLFGNECEVTFYSERGEDDRGSFWIVEPEKVMLGPYHLVLSDDQYREIANEIKNKIEQGMM